MDEEETMWYEWGTDGPVLVDVRKVDDEVLALILCHAAGERGYENYFDPHEHSAIIGLAWTRGLLSLDDKAVDRALRELGVS